MGIHDLYPYLIFAICKKWETTNQSIVTSTTLSYLASTQSQIIKSKLGPQSMLAVRGEKTSSWEWDSNNLVTKQCPLREGNVMSQWCSLQSANTRKASFGMYSIVKSISIIFVSPWTVWCGGCYWVYPLWKWHFSSLLWGFVENEPCRV